MIPLLPWFHGSRRHTICPRSLVQFHFIVTTLWNCPKSSGPFYIVTHYIYGSLLLGHTVCKSSACVCLCLFFVSIDSFLFCRQFGLVFRVLLLSCPIMLPAIIVHTLDVFKVEMNMIVGTLISPQFFSAELSFKIAI